MGGAVADLFLAPRVLAGACGRSFMPAFSDNSHEATHGPWILKYVSEIVSCIVGTTIASHQTDSWKITIRKLD